MDGKRLIEKLRLHNILSFGPEGIEVELQPLNVLIGPNASGKSNLIEAVGLLHAAPRDLAKPFREGGGIDEWLWKGGRSSRVADLVASVWYMELPGVLALRHSTHFSSSQQHLTLLDEQISGMRAKAHDDEGNVFVYRHPRGNPASVARTVDKPAVGRELFSLPENKLDAGQSVLSQLRDPDQYPEITYLGDQFGAIRLYRDWNFGRTQAPRRPQPTDLPEDTLEEDASNLGLVLNHLENQGMKRALVERARVFCEDIEDITTKVQGGTIQVFVHERGRGPIPATRLSDGTLRYLCLLTILCHPDPPPLVCIEEPELGLHPDILSTVAELLIEASGRMQLIVTTHSDILVSALSEVPESVLVCDRDEHGTQLTRLERGPLEEWLEKYSLGDYWLSGGIGGTRW